ncbi:MAG TPA: class I SAM-dependent methyltransferase, partial [Candidatus Limnocylindria bacterium]|nr:class I SAM-dependent methyltransferase [Candidatus Limnocylindria bacterium]
MLGKLRKALGGDLRAFERALELGAGTGYFSLNLMQAGVISAGTCTDISPGMVAVLARNAQALDLEVDARVADAEALP